MFSKRFLFVSSVVAVLGIFALFLCLFQNPISLDITEHQLKLPRTSILHQNCRGGSDWGDFDVYDYTLKDIIKYAEWTNSTSCRLSQDFGGTVIYTVGLDGQKAVCLDQNVRPGANVLWPTVVKEELTDCLVYSFGINFDWSFDEAMESFGCRVYAFDPSMNLSDHNHSSNIHFYNIGLSDRYEHGTKKHNWSKRSLDFIYHNLLGHQDRVIDYLKIDIENDEWIVLPQILSSGMMDKVRQLGVEIHISSSKNGMLADVHKRVKVLKSLEDYGLIRFDSKLNPLSYSLNNIENSTDMFGVYTYEIAWFNSKLIRHELV